MVGSRRTRRFPFEGASGPALLRRGEDLTICIGDHALRPWSGVIAATDGADTLRGGSGCARPVQHPGRAVSQAARSGGRRSSRRWAAHAQFCLPPERRHGALATRLLSGENTPESDYVTSLCERVSNYGSPIVIPIVEASTTDISLWDSVSERLTTDFVSIVRAAPAPATSAKYAAEAPSGRGRPEPG